MHPGYTSGMDTEFPTLIDCHSLRRTEILKNEIDLKTIDEKID